MALSQLAKATTTVKQTVQMTPSLRRKLLTNLRSFQELKAQRDAIDAAMDEHKEVISEIRAEVGEKALELEGFKISYIEPTRKTLNYEKLVALGCSMEWIKDATEEKPTKAYDKVTCPGEKEKEY